MKPERGRVEDRSSTAKTGSVAQLVLKFNPECSLSMGEVPGSKPGRSNSSPNFFISFFCHSLFLILSSEIFLESPSALIHQSAFLTTFYLPSSIPSSIFLPTKPCLSLPNPYFQLLCVPLWKHDVLLTSVFTLRFSFAFEFESFHFSKAL